MIRSLPRAALMLCAAATVAVGQTQHPPEVPPQLEIAGAVARPQALTLEALATFPTAELVTTTPWHEGAGPQSFAGFSALAVLDAAGPQGEIFVFTALDGYELDAPREMLVRFPALLATELNGAPLDPETYGPFWLVFPYDEIPEDAREAYAAISVWALDRITVRAAE
ncbi:MAG: molybdopterin-dependent oxidoreductase [Pikeienuella sp.]